MSSDIEAEKNYKITLASLLKELKLAGVHIAVGAPGGEDLESARNAWFKMLHREIPLEALETTVWDAVRKKCDPNPDRFASSPRALAASDVLKHYRGTQAEAQEKNRLNRILAPKICTYCKNTRKVTVYNVLLQKEITKDCPFHTSGRRELL